MHDAARRLQAAVDEQVERAVALALRSATSCPARKQPRLGVVEQQRPVLLAAARSRKPGRPCSSGSWLPSGSGRSRSCPSVTARSGSRCRRRGWRPRSSRRRRRCRAACSPTGIGEPTTRPVFGSSRVTVLSSLLVTHTKPWPKASWRGSRPTLDRAEQLAGLAVQARDGAVAGVGDPGGVGGLDHAARLACRR